MLQLKIINSMKNREKQHDYLNERTNIEQST